MKLWVPTRAMLSYPDPNRPVPSHALHLRHFNRILISSPYLPGRELRLTNPQCTRQRSILLLHLYLYTYCPRPVLRLLPLQGNLKYWCSPSTSCYDNSLRRLCPPMGPNIFLRCYSNYESPLRCTICGQCSSSMNLGRIFSGQCNTNTVLRISLSISICNCCRNHTAPPVSTRNWIQQPHRAKLGRRQDPLPPILYI